MLDITELKKGTVFVFNDEPFKVVDYSQKVMGRGGSIVNVRIKSLPFYLLKFLKRYVVEVAQ